MRESHHQHYLLALGLACKRLLENAKDLRNGLLRLLEVIHGVVWMFVSRRMSIRMPLRSICGLYTRTSTTFSLPLPL